MNSRYPSLRASTVIALCSLALTSVSCRKNQAGDGPDDAPAVIIAHELLTNQIGSLPGAVYQNQALSPIHWQPWTSETLERARAARRLLLCVIVLPQHSGFQKTFSALAADPASLQAINNNYVPVLIDGDTIREMSILTADLCGEIDRGVGLPLFVWMTHEANPVAWIPVTGADAGEVRSMFNQSHTMISQIWNDSPEYVLGNSASDNTNRRGRFQRRKVIKVMSSEPEVDALKSLRQLVVLYDPYTRSLDEAGGLVPSSSIELLASSAVHPELPPELRESCLETTQELLMGILSSAMFDPLDGGVFSARRSATWSLPSFVRTCPSQARVAVSLLAAHRATGNPRALEKALGLIAFAEKAHATPEGLFAVGLSAVVRAEDWMWSVEDVTRILGPEDAEWWIRATAMKGLGNLPSEADPQREYFRSNTLGLKQTVGEIASSLSLPLETFKPRFEAAKSKLLAVRNQRLGKPRRDECPHAPSTFRMVSAYAAAFCATGDEVYRDKATALLQRARNAFTEGPRLRSFATEAPPSIGAGRAFLYALAMQAILDVAAITLDDQWLVWSEDLATTSAELFTGNDLLKECPDNARLIDLPVTDLMMLFDDSTAGLLSLDESRLAALGRPLVAAFSKLATPLPTYTVEQPVLHTDLLIATLARHYPVTVVYGESLSPTLQLAVERLPMRIYNRRAARAGEDVPAGAVKVLIGENPDGRIVTTAETLAEALLPSSENS